MPDRLGNVAEQSEQVLLSAVARGDGEAADALFRLFGDSVLRFVYRRVGNLLEDAEEITLDTFVSAIKLAPTFEPNSSVFCWLCGIAKLRIVDFYRRSSAAKRLPPQMAEELTDMNQGAATLEQLLDRMEAQRVVEALLSNLNGEEREALLLRFGDGLSTREAALHMNRSERGVESLILRAKSKAKGQMGRWIRGGAV